MCRYQQLLSLSLSLSSLSSDPLNCIHCSYKANEYKSLLVDQKYCDYIKDSIGEICQQFPVGLR